MRHDEMKECKIESWESGLGMRNQGKGGMMYILHRANCDIVTAIKAMNTVNNEININNQY